MTWLVTRSGAGDDGLRHARDMSRIAPVAFDKRDFQIDQQQATAPKRNRIRCPVCKWQPGRRNRWYCLPMGAPEHFSGGCGHGWNTFDTRGLCPGCSYQWRHTSCLSCGVTSVHEDWYEAGRDAPAKD